MGYRLVSKSHDKEADKAENHCVAVGDTDE